MTITTTTECTSLKQYRKLVLRITADELSERLGGVIKKGRIGNIENGSQPAEYMVAALAKSYDLTIDEFWRLWRRLPALGGASHGNGNGSAVATNGSGALSHAQGLAGESAPEVSE